MPDLYLTQYQILLDGMVLKMIELPMLLLVQSMQIHMQKMQERLPRQLSSVQIRHLKMPLPHRMLPTEKLIHSSNHQLPLEQLMFFLRDLVTSGFKQTIQSIQMEPQTRLPSIEATASLVDLIIRFG